MPVDDRQIIALFDLRDEEAVTQAAEKYSVYCRTIAERILHNPEDAEEAVNDTWLAAWNSIPPKHPACLKNFLGSLTRNISLNRIRAEHTQKRGGEELRVVWDELAGWLRSGENVEETFTAQELAAAINRFLGEISDTERRVFVRRYWYMQPLAEIAEKHGFTVGKVKNILFRTRKKLYARLKEEGFL